MFTGSYTNSLGNSVLYMGILINVTGNPYTPMSAISRFTVYNGGDWKWDLRGIWKSLSELPAIYRDSQGISVILVVKIFSVQSIQVAAC